MPLPAAQSTGEASGKISNEDTSSSSTGGSAVAPKAPQNIDAAVPTAAPGEFTVVIQTREESWISITADGKTAPSELLAAGSERVIRGRKEVIVKAGNAGGIDFRFNGKKLDIGGQLGEVKTVTFGPGGMVTNAAPPPSTP